MEEFSDFRAPLYEVKANLFKGLVNIRSFGVHPSCVWGPVGRARSSGLGSRAVASLGTTPD